MTKPARHFSIFLFWAATFLFMRDFRDPIVIPFATLLMVGWFFRRALEHARRPPKGVVSRWFRFLTTLHLDLLEEPFRRMVPLGFSLVGAGEVLAGARGTAWFTMAAFSAAAILGARAGMGEFTARRYRQDLVYGAEGWLVAAALGVAGLPLVNPVLAQLAAVVIVVSCGIMAASEEPLRLTRPPLRKRLAVGVTLPVRSFTRGGR